MFHGSELNGLAFKALVPQCCLSCLKGLGQTATLRVSNFSALVPRGGRGWMIHLPIFTVESLEARQAIKSHKAQGLCSCSVSHIIFHILLDGNKNLLLWFWTGIPGFCWNRENEKIKKNLQRKIRFYHRCLESNDLDLKAAFSFFTSPHTLICSLLSVKDVLKYAIITAFHCLMVSMHMNFSHSSFWERHDHSVL